MNSQVYSREYLQGLHAARRKDMIKHHIQPYVQKILGAAGSGQTSILLQEDKNHTFQMQHFQNNGMTPPTQEEICETLQEQFPDSKIEYQEKWVQITRDKQELKKGLNVDWS